MNTYTALDVAKWILCQVDVEAGDSITHLKLQKLIYYCQAWALALLGRPIFDEEIQAWAHGPVVRSVYDEYKEYKWNAIPQPDDCPSFDEDVEELMHSVYGVYSDKSAKSLESLTHSEAPWINAREGFGPEEFCKVVIAKEAMGSYYRARYDESEG